MCILIILFVFILIFILTYNGGNSREGFDARIEGGTKTQCGTICSKVLGCTGFAYDAENKNCYLARDKITFAPSRHERPRHENVFAQFYKWDMPRCNKLYTINDPLFNSRNNLLRNITYICKDIEEGYPTYKMYNGTEIPVNDVTRINQYTVKPYTFEDIEWGTVINLDKNLELLANTNDNVVNNPVNTNYLKVAPDLEYKNQFSKFSWLDIDPNR